MRDRIDNETLRPDIQEFLETKQIIWNGLYINADGAFVPFSNRNHKFRHGLLCTHMQENGKLKTKFIKVSQYDLSFYEYKENHKGKGRFEVEQDFIRDWRIFLYTKYGTRYLDILEEYKKGLQQELDILFYKNPNPILENTVEYMKTQNYIDNLDMDLDYLYHKSNYESKYNEPYEESLQSLEELLDPETLELLYPEKTEDEDEDEDPYNDPYYFEESDKDDDDEYEK